MDFLDLARKRFSMRQFDTRPLSNEDINLILEAGRLAPTAKNLQPQKIFVLTSEEALSKLLLCRESIFGAKTAFLVCYDKNESWKRDCDGYDSGYVDATIVATQMMLEATSIGVGTTFIMWYDVPTLISEFNLPENIVPVCILAAGYPSEQTHPSRMHTDRKPLFETVKFI
jgi:nitroreductase